MNGSARNAATSAARSLAAQHRLIFRWPEGSASFVLPLLFLATVAAHALTFYCFQVIYPPAVALAPPPAQVTFLTPSNPKNAALLRWVDAQVPSAVNDEQELTPPHLGEIVYTPSYLTPRPLPKNVERQAPVIALPSGRDPMELVAPLAKPAVAQRVKVASSLSFSHDLQSRDAMPDRSIALESKSSSSLQPSVFLIGVGESGDVRYCFLQTSCGDRVIDKQAEGLLQTHSFTKTALESPVTWGFATFVWGAEAFAAPSPASPTPQKTTAG